MTSPSKNRWIIVGCDSTQEIFRRSVPLGSLSEKEMTELLRRLAARHLNDDEIFASSLRKNARGWIGHLEVHRDSGPSHFHLMTHGNPHYAARVGDVDDA